jgi:hypothetical protein
MNTKSSSINVWILFGVCAALIIFTFILVIHNEAMPDKIQHERHHLLSVGKAAL